MLFVTRYVITNKNFYEDVLTRHNYRKKLVYCINFTLLFSVSGHLISTTIILGSILDGKIDTYLNRLRKLASLYKSPSYPTYLTFLYVNKTCLFLYQKSVLTWRMRYKKVTHHLFLLQNGCISMTKATMILRLGALNVWVIILCWIWSILCHI